MREQQNQQDHQQNNTRYTGNQAARNQENQEEDITTFRLNTNFFGLRDQFQYIDEASIPKTKFEFPKFNGMGLNNWLYKVTQFFTCQQTHPKQWIRICTVHFEDEPMEWFTGWAHDRDSFTWDEFVNALENRYGESIFRSPGIELKDLRQTLNMSVIEYQSQFQKLRCKV